MTSLRRGVLTVAGCAVAVLGMVYADLWLRARSAYLEGEKYLEWNLRPKLKKSHFDAKLAAKEKRLRGLRSKGELTAGELKDRLELARFQRDERVAESSLKYATIWFQTAVELFSPPESKWVVLSRKKRTEAKELWKNELDAKGIPYQDYMLE